MSQELFVCSGLEKRFGRHTVLHNVNLSLEKGKIIGLLGPNGSGKTTLIKLANGLLKPDGGSLTIDGREPGIYTKSVVSYLPDRMYFADWMRVEDMIRMFSDFYRDFREDAVREMLGSLNISAKEKMKTLSKGTKEKVQLALVMSRKAKLYLLDEPIGGVDPAAREFILNTILTNYSEDASVIISTHLISDVEKVLDEAVFLKDGQIVRHDTIDNIRNKEGKSVDRLFREIFAVPMPAHREGYRELSERAYEEDWVKDEKEGGEKNV